MQGPVRETWDTDGQWGQGGRFLGPLNPWNSGSQAWGLAAGLISEQSLSWGVMGYWVSPSLPMQDLALFYLEGTGDSISNSHSQIWMLQLCWGSWKAERGATMSFLSTPVVKGVNRRVRSGPGPPLGLGAGCGVPLTHTLTDPGRPHHTVIFLGSSREGLESQSPGRRVHSPAPLPFFPSPQASLS